MKTSLGNLKPEISKEMFQMNSNLSPIGEMMDTVMEPQSGKQGDEYDYGEELEMEYYPDGEFSEDEQDQSVQETEEPVAA